MQFKATKTSREPAVLAGFTYVSEFAKANRCTRTGMATSPRKCRTVKGQSQLIKATKHSVSREIAGRGQHVGMAAFEHGEEHHPFPNVQVATPSPLVSEAAPNTPSKVRACQQGVTCSQGRNKSDAAGPGRCGSVVPGSTLVTNTSLVAGSSPRPGPGVCRRQPVEASVSLSPSLPFYLELSGKTSSGEN